MAVSRRSAFEGDSAKADVHARPPQSPKTVVGERPPRLGRLILVVEKYSEKQARVFDASNGMGLTSIEKYPVTSAEFGRGGKKGHPSL